MGLAWRQVQEAPTATHKPNNGQDPEQGLSPNAKKEKARTSGVGVDANKAIDMSFKTFRAMTKTARHNGGVNPPGDKAIIKSTMAPAANQKTESADLVAEKKKNGMHKMPDGSMMRDDDPSMKKEMMKKKSVKAAYHGEAMDKKKPVKAAYHGEAMDPVGKADADIDNDGDVDSSDKYLHKRRKAISKSMKSKGKKEGAIMHGGKGGAKSEKKEKEVMAVGEDMMPNKRRQMKDPKRDAMVVKKGKVKVIDKSKEADHLKRGYNRAEDYSTPAGGSTDPGPMPKTMKRPPMPQKGLLPPTVKKGSAY